RTRLRIHVDVPAIRPSTSNSFEYTRKRTIDIWSSGSFAMSVRMTMRCLATCGSIRSEMALKFGGVSGRVGAGACAVVQPAVNASTNIQVRRAAMRGNLTGRSRKPTGRWMSFQALATDYDGTIADRGVVDEPTVAALDRVRQSGRKLLLV